MAQDKKKVMDVAKPSEAEPDTGSKPMVVGHRSMAADPTLKKDEAPAEEPAKEEEKLETKKKVKIEPLSLQKSKDGEVEAKPTEEKSEENADDKPAKEEPKEPAKKDKDESAEPKADDKEKKDADAVENKEDNDVMAHEARLQALIKSKEYFVPIKESSATATKTFLVTFLLVGLLGVVIVAALIDAEVLDLGITLPFDLL